MPSIWAPGARSLYNPFVKLLSRGSQTSNPEYWRKIKILFEVLKISREIPISELVKWVNGGLLVGAATELRPSAGMAYETSYSILVDLISGFEDPAVRNATLQTEFGSKLHQYLASKDSSAFHEQYLNQAFSRALVDLGERGLSDFQTIWSSECQWLQDMISTILSPSEAEVGFNVASRRWVRLTLSMISEIRQNKSEAILSPLLEATCRTLEASINTISNMKGNWVDGMSFLSTMLEDSIFNEVFRNASELEAARNTIQAFMSPQNIVTFLHSPSTATFIPVLLSYCLLFGEENPDAWKTFVSEAIPENAPMDIQTPNTILARIVAIPQKDWDALRGKVQPPIRDYENLVSAVIRSLKESESSNADENERAQGLVISLMSLRGMLKGSSTSLIVELLISNEAATSLFWGLDENLKSFLPIAKSISARDPGFFDLIIEARRINADDLTRDFTLAGFISKIYENRADPQYPSSCNLANSRFLSLFETLKGAISSSSSSDQIIKSCLDLVKAQVQKERIPPSYYCKKIIL